MNELFYSINPVNCYITHIVIVVLVLVIGGLVAMWLTYRHEPIPGALCLLLCVILAFAVSTWLSDPDTFQDFLDFFKLI